MHPSSTPKRHPIRRLFARLALFSACGTLLAIGTWLLAPTFCQDPWENLKKQTPVRIYRDNQGTVIHLERTYDYQWRFDAPLETYSPETIQIILATEDRRFFQHHGVDYPAVLRALWLDITHGKVLSGASTLSMQLASIAHPRKRSLITKFLQASEARKLEKLHGKEDILAAYLNHIPLGGKIHGLQAAALYYFGLQANQLNQAEIALLCGIPQRPNAYRPDKHFDLARKRQRRVLKLMVNDGLISNDQAEALFLRSAIRLRDFSTPSPLQRLSQPSANRHFLELARRQAPPDSYDIHCAINQELTASITHALRQHVRQLPGVSDAAAVLLDNKTKKAVALIGTIDFASPNHGQVNAATAIRSAGSTLKPFIYLEAFDAGLVTLDTRIPDTPIRYGTYSPTNYDGHFNGTIRVAEALYRSLNTPAVQLLADLTPPRILQTFETLHLIHHPKATSLDELQTHGLAIALGAMGHALLPLTQAYAAIANLGAWQPYSFLQTDTLQPSTNAAFSPGACALITKILTMSTLPGTADLDIAWKTGTSNGNHDAWCFGFTPDYTLGVWFGNKNGQPAASLVGASAAAPAVADIFQSIYRNTVPSPWPDDSSCLKTTALCAKSGLRATAACKERTQGVVINHAPLMTCNQCGVFAKVPSLHILSPSPKTYLSQDGLTANIILQASQTDVHWFVDGTYKGFLPQGQPTSFPIGKHTLQIIAPDGKGIPDAITFFVSAE